MFSKRFSLASLFLMGTSIVVTGFATAAADDTEDAVNLLAIESLCIKANPASDSNVENALNSDPKTTDSLRTEVRRVKGDPAYKPRIQSMASAMSTSIVASKIPDLCSYYVPKKG